MVLVAGGGIRNLADLRSMEQAGCDAVLGATALPNGLFTATNLREAGYAL